MQWNFRGRSQNVNGYADQPFTFVDPDAHRLIGHITSIDLVENGERRGREYWQKKQFANLVNHAYLRSEFWRGRIPSGAGRQEVLQNFPILTRKEINAQVQKEGSVFGDKKQSVETYQSTGSTGTPLKVFACPQSTYYNVARSLAQFFIDDFPLDENRVEITPAVRTDHLKKTMVYKTGSTWAGPLSRVYQNGSNKVLGFDKDIAGLLEEMSRDRVGYLVSQSRFVEQMLDHGGLDLFEKLGIKLWIHKSDLRSPDLVEQLKKIGIPSLSNYSAGELGPIGFECKVHEGHFHVATTNVIVESDRNVTTTFGGETIGRLLITHLHSYATPIIRYDIGDFGKLHDQCPCGHSGPAISHIYGRGKHFLRHPDGRYLPFFLSTKLLVGIVAFSECRFRQDAIDTITVQIGGRESLSQEEEDKLRAAVIAASDPAFRVEIRPVKAIDWSDSPKQLFFTSSVN